MRKILAVGLMAAVFALALPLHDAHAGGNELMYSQVQNLGTLAPSAVNPLTDYEPVYQASSGKMKKVLARGSASIVVPTQLAATTVLDATACGKEFLLNSAGVLNTTTLPAATGTGCRITMTVQAINTSNYVVNPAGTDKIKGGLIFASDNASNAELGFENTSASHVTLNGTTSGGAAIGDYATFVDIAAGVWVIRGQVTESGSEVTPFS